MAQPDVTNQTPPPIPGPPALPAFGTEYKPWESIDPSYSQEQWAAWEPSRDASCPPDRPYKAERKDANGNPITTCVEKPVDCPPGSRAFGADQCLPDNDPRVAGGGGGGGGGGMGGGGGIGGPDLSALFGIGGDTSEAINAALMDIINGGQTRFSPEVMADIEGGAKLREQTSIARQSTALREQQAARGVAFSPLASEQERLINAGAASDFEATMRDARVQKATSDFTDKMAAISAAQNWLNSLRNYALGLDSNSVQREQISASLELGYANIRAQMEMLTQRLASDKELLGMQLDSSEWAQIQKMILCINYGTC